MKALNVILPIYLAIGFFVAVMVAICFATDGRWIGVRNLLLLMFNWPWRLWRGVILPFIRSQTLESFWRGD